MFKCNCLRKSPIQNNRFSQIDFSCCFSESPYQTLVIWQIFRIFGPVLFDSRFDLAIIFKKKNAEFQHFQIDKKVFLYWAQSN